MNQIVCYFGFSKKEILKERLDLQEIYLSRISVMEAGERAKGSERTLRPHCKSDPYKGLMKDRSLDKKSLGLQ